MKAVLLFMLLTFLFQNSKSQIFIKDKNINADSTIRYFQIKVNADHKNFFSIYSVDYGQNQPLFSLYSYYIADSSGKKKKFRSTIDLLQYITSNGWKLLQRDLVSTSNGPYAYLLFERVTEQY